MKKKVLMVNKYLYHTGGIEEFVRSFLSMKNEDIHINFIACSSPEISRFSAVFDPRVFIYKTNFVLFNTPISFPFFFGLVRKYFSHDVIHINSPFPTAEIIIFFLSLIQKKKIIITYHSDVVKQKKVLFFIRGFIQGLLKRSDYICITSPSLKASPFLKKYIGKINVIPIGQTDHASYFFKKYEEKSYALFVGRLVYYKGVFVLLEAMKNYSGTLKIVGEGTLQKEMLEYIQKNNLADKIEILGFVDDSTLWDLYKNASFFVFPSIETTEAFGIVQIQAMSFGLPIVNTNLPTGVPWVARDGREAITTPVGDSSALCIVMETLHNSFEIRQRLGQAGRLRFLETFTQDGMFQAYKNIYL